MEMQQWGLCQEGPQRGQTRSVQSNKIKKKNKNKTVFNEATSFYDPNGKRIDINVQDGNVVLKQSGKLDHVLA